MKTELLQKGIFGNYLKPSTAAVYMDSSYNSVMNLVREKKIKARQLENGEWRIFRTSIDAFMDIPDEEEVKDKETVDNLSKVIV